VTGPTATPEPPPGGLDLPPLADALAGVGRTPTDPDAHPAPAVLPTSRKEVHFMGGEGCHGGPVEAAAGYKAPPSDPSDPAHPAPAVLDCGAVRNQFLNILNAAAGGIAATDTKPGADAAQWVADAVEVVGDALLRLRLLLGAGPTGVPGTAPPRTHDPRRS
jgi:hypothetical protein